jgi:hypothetical protein
LEVLDEYPATARALAFTARIAASYAMQYYRPAPSLTDFANIPLEQRLSILYAYTESYGKHQDYSEMIHYDQCEKLAIENRHYVFINHGLDMNNVLIKNSDINAVKKGYTIPSGSNVNPYNMDEYTNGFLSYIPQTVNEVKAILGK